MKHLAIIILLVYMVSVLVADRASGYATYGPIRISTITPPTFSLPEGSYSGTQSIVLSSSAGANARIRYTINGGEPTYNSGILYTGPISINQTSTIKAISYINGVHWSVSPVKSQTYAFSTFFPPLLTFSIDNSSGAEPVTSVQLKLNVLGSAITSAITKEVTDNMVTFNHLDLIGLVPFVKISSVSLIGSSGSMIGHMKFEYTRADYVSSNKYNVQLFIHDEHIPFSPGNGGNWEYYSQNERMVSMLIKPPTVNPQRQPMMLVHGVGGAFPAFGRKFIKQLNGNPNTTADDTNDIWEFYYPYDQQIEYSAPLLGSAIQFIRQYYPGNPNPQRVNVIAHSMGGLVTRTYIQSCLGIDSGIRKFLMLGTPNHGSHSSFRISHPMYYPMSSAQNEIFVDIDNNSPAVRQMYPGSPFLMQLNSNPPNNLYPGSDNQNTYLVLAGTQNEFRLLPDYVAGWEHYNPASNDDIVVSTASASLLEWGIPLATVNYNHQEIHGTKPVNIPLVFSEMNPDFLSTFFTESYSASGNPFGTAVDDFWLTPQNGDNRASLINLRFNKNLNSEMIEIKKSGVGNTLKLTFKSSEDIEEDMSTDEERLYLGSTNRLRKSGAYNNQSHYFMEQKTIHMDGLIVFPRYGQTANLSSGNYDLKFYNYYGQLVKTIPNGISINGLTTTGMNIDLTNAESACIQLNNTNNPNQTTRVRDGLNRNYIEKQYYIDSTINSTIFYLGDEEDIVGFENHNAHLIDPMNTVIDPVTAVSRPDVEYVEDIAAGFAYYYVENPMQGTWLLRYNDTLSDDLSTSLVDSPLSITIDFSQGTFSAGDIVPFSLPLPQDQDYSNPLFTVAMSYTDSMSVIHDLGLVPVVLNPEQTHYTGSFNATAPGQYKLAVNFTCLSDEQMVQRYSERSIHIQKAVPPSLQYPQNNGLNLPITLTMKWNSVANADSYQLSLYRQEESNPLVAVVVADTLFAVENLDHDTQYHWCVSSTSSYGSSMMSDVYSFKTTLAPPLLSYPEHGATNIPQSVVVTWQAVAGASGYGFQLSQYPDFEDYWINTSNINATSFELSGLNQLETYYWRTRGVSENSNGEWSEIRSFTVRPTAIEFPAELTVLENSSLVLFFQNHIDDYDPSQYQIVVEDNINLQIDLYLDRFIVTPPSQWHGSEDITIKVLSDSRHLNGSGKSDRESEIIYQSVISIVVTEVNDLPELNLGESLIFWDSEDKTIDLSPYLIDVDNDLGEIYVSATGTTNLGVQVDGHIVSFTAPEGWRGSEVIEIQLSNSAPRVDYLGSMNYKGYRTEDDFNSYYIFISIVDATPIIKSHTLSGNEFTLTWDSVLGADSYRVYSCSTPNGMYSDVTQAGNLVQVDNQYSWHKMINAEREFFYLKAIKGERSVISSPIKPLAKPNRLGR